jgi:hypothetical protein
MQSNVVLRAPSFIFIKGDDGTLDLSGLSKDVYYQASLIITDAGRIIKNRFSNHKKCDLTVIDLSSFLQSVKEDKSRVKEDKSPYRSIEEPWNELQD